MTKLKLLDLYCGAGGAAQGYIDAGFDVTGIDINPQPDYPGKFIQGDALAYLAAHGHEYDARHASPPCQASSTLTKGTNKGKEYLNLIPATRALLRVTGGPWVMENVQGSDLRRDLTLCGEMFGLGVIRHRYFEVEGWQAFPAPHKPHRGRVAGWRHGEWFDGPYFAVYGEGGGKGTVAQWQEAMGIHWTSNRKSIAEAIPPAYTRFIGGQLMQQIESAREIEALAS
ncbi:DNA cytosine methyltransferase [Glutamicibacter arilaitensis]|uniref:DNA cytosine methyltransferase n=1 Tax=Glutamicibacter arilaitensis TaxID=256701 RepID=A0A4Y8TZJ6_9MICC|nr:DNA cytosine methyltransferase [Glutamicibacter arilaitensis]TFH57298.1 DNA cytosine methyltransferase [Glutamicibacter arilaitensis]